MIYLKKKFSLSNTPQTVGELTQEEKDELIKVAKERIRQILAKEKNEELEFHRNAERFAFLKWGEKAFNNFRIVPPGNGIVH